MHARLIRHRYPADIGRHVREHKVWSAPAENRFELGPTPPPPENHRE